MLDRVLTPPEVVRAKAAVIRNDSVMLHEVSNNRPSLDKLPLTDVALETHPVPVDFLVVSKWVLVTKKLVMTDDTADVLVPFPVEVFAGKPLLEVEILLKAFFLLSLLDQPSMFLMHVSPDMTRVEKLFSAQGAFELRELAMETLPACGDLAPAALVTLFDLVLLVDRRNVIAQTPLGDKCLHTVNALELRVPFLIESPKLFPELGLLLLSRHFL